jgi:hypothetical protein
LYNFKRSMCWVSTLGSFSRAVLRIESELSPLLVGFRSAGCHFTYPLFSWYWANSSRNLSYSSLLSMEESFPTFFGGILPVVLLTEESSILSITWRNRWADRAGLSGTSEVGAMMFAPSRRVQVTPSLRRLARRSAASTTSPGSSSEISYVRPSFFLCCMLEGSNPGESFKRPESCTRAWSIS